MSKYKREAMSYSKTGDVVAEFEEFYRRNHDDIDAMKYVVGDHGRYTFRARRSIKNDEHYHVSFDYWGNIAEKNEWIIPVSTGWFIYSGGADAAKMFSILEM